MIRGFSFFKTCTSISFFCQGGRAVQRKVKLGSARTETCFIFYFLHFPSFPIVVNSTHVAFDLFISSTQLKHYVDEINIFFGLLISILLITHSTSPNWSLRGCCSIEPWIVEVQHNFRSQIHPLFDMT